jgi:hypothetical protein
VTDQTELRLSRILSQLRKKGRRLKSIQRHGCGAVVAAFILSLSTYQTAIADGGVSALVPGKACERAVVRKLVFSHGGPPDTLIVRATGPTCMHAKIVVTLRTASRHTIWTEWAYLSVVEFTQFPDEEVPEVTFEHVIGVVENWVSVENSSEAPAWPDGISSLAEVPASGLTQYDTKLNRRRYERIRAAHEPMLCIPIGPESAHCIAMDPSTQTLVELLSRGV